MHRRVAGAFFVFCGDSHHHPSPWRCCRVRPPVHVARCSTPIHRARRHWPCRCTAPNVSQLPARAVYTVYTVRTLLTRSCGFRRCSAAWVVSLVGYLAAAVIITVALVGVNVDDGLSGNFDAPKGVVEAAIALDVVVYLAAMAWLSTYVLVDHEYVAPPSHVFDPSDEVGMQGRAVACSHAQRVRDLHCQQKEYAKYTRAALTIQRALKVRGAARCHCDVLVLLLTPVPIANQRLRSQVLAIRYLEYEEYMSDKVRCCKHPVVLVVEYCIHNCYHAPCHTVPDEPVVQARAWHCVWSAAGPAPHVLDRVRRYSCTIHAVSVRTCCSTLTTVDVPRPVLQPVARPLMGGSNSGHAVLGHLRPPAVEVFLHVRCVVPWACCARMS